MPRTQKNRLTIGLLLDTTFDSNDGVQQYVKLLGGWLADQGHEVHYVVGHSDKKDSRIHSMSRLTTIRFNGNTIRSPLPANRSVIVSLLDSIDFDVLHVQTPHSPFMAHKVITHPKNHAAVVGTFHIMPYSLLEKWSIKLLGVVLRRSLRRINIMLAVSRPAAQLTEVAFGLPTTVVPNAVDVSRFSSNNSKRLLPSGVTNIVFLGRLEQRKGCMYVLQALRLLDSQNKLGDMHLTVCSDGPQRQSLEQFVTNNNLGDRVSFKGYIDEADKPLYLRDADVAVFPSTSGESFGIVLIEAMAAGSSVVLAGDNPGYRSVMEGLENQLFNPRNTDTFAQLLLHHAHDIKGRVAIKAKQLQTVKKFDIPAVGGRIESIYYEAIAKKQKLQDNTL